MGTSNDLREHLQRPQVRGLLGSPIFGIGENTACGDVLRVELAEDAAGHLRVGYQVRGCAALVAVSSLCCSIIEGMDLERAGAFDVQAAIDQAGGLNRRGAHAARIFERALQQALLVLKTA